jgi:hypothetical protein
MRGLLGPARKGCRRGFGWWAVFFGVLAVPGCGPKPAPEGGAPLNITVPAGVNASISWSSGRPDARPGIDAAMVNSCTWGGAPAFVLWTDLNNDASSSAEEQGSFVYSGSQTAPDGRKVRYRCRTRDGRTGDVTIDDRTYDLAKGALFLVSAREPRTRVLQLQRDVRQLTLSTAKLQQFARDDPEMVAFFAGAKGPN